MRANVAGPVLEVGPHFRPGGFVAAEELLLEIDPQDYELALAAARIDVTLAEAGVLEAESLMAQRATALDEARARRRLEEGQAEVARRELEMLGEGGHGMDRDLVLRVPQRAIAEAAIASAEAGYASAEAARASALARVAAAEHRVAEAQLDRDRTTVRAPFAAWILDRLVEKGGFVTTTTDIVRLVATETCHVEVLVPASDLAWIDLPEPGTRPEATVELRDEAAWPEGAVRHGRIVGWLGDLDAIGRMARLLVEVDDPLRRGTPPPEGPPLLVGAVLRAALPGKALPSAVALERRLLRHGDVVWIAAPDDTLEIRPVDVAWRGQDEVLLRGGITAADRVVTTDLGTPVAGMALRVTDADIEAP